MYFKAHCTYISYNYEFNTPAYNQNRLLFEGSSYSRKCNLWLTFTSYNYCYQQNALASKCEARPSVDSNLQAIINHTKWHSQLTQFMGQLIHYIHTQVCTVHSSIEFWTSALPLQNSQVFKPDQWLRPCDRWNHHLYNYFLVIMNPYTYMYIICDQICQNVHRHRFHQQRTATLIN